MKQLPEQPSLEHLKKQAKDLLRFYKNGDAEALDRFSSFLPAAAGKTHSNILALNLHLHDAQSCVAREYGFPSWQELRSYVEAKATPHGDHAFRVLAWLRLVYAGEIAGGNNRSRPSLAARRLTEDRGFTGGDVYLACAIGDEDALRQVTKNDPHWVNRPGGPLNLPPLIAVTHSSLLQLPAFRDRLHQSAKLLLDAGADPNTTRQTGACRRPERAASHGGIGWPFYFSGLGRNVCRVLRLSPRLHSHARVREGRRCPLLARCTS
jgi:hypothetical protein